MSFFGKIGRGFKATGRALKPALPLATLVLGANPIAAMGLKVLSNILSAEKAFPVSGSGMEKAQYVRERISRELPGILRTAEAVRGKEFVDEEAVTKALDDLIDAQFRLASLTGLVNKG